MSGYVDHSVPLRHKSNGAAYGLLFLLLLLPYASGQSDSNPSSQYPYKNINSSMMVILVIFFVIFLLIALMSVFIRHCFHDSGDWSSNFTRRRPSTARFWKFHRGGLDTLLVESFPTFSFSEIKDRKIGNINAALECAVCLNELDDGEILRLLPICGHVFHRDCIDNWIASHNTCPVCRTDLSKKLGTARKQTDEHDLVVVESRTDVGETDNNQISITISNVVVHNNTFPSDNLKPEKEIRFEKLRRSRSTGHLTSKVKRVNSCVVFLSDNEGGSSERGNRGGGEGSNLERPGGWPFLERPGSADAVKIDGDGRPPSGLPV